MQNTCFQANCPPLFQILFQAQAATPPHHQGHPGIYRRLGERLATARGIMASTPVTAATPPHCRATPTSTAGWASASRLRAASWRPYRSHLSKPACVRRARRWTRHTRCGEEPR
eukprot:187896-Chlamydomonas_euryale.AAC.2